MANISITFNTTAAQDAKLARLLARVNAVRASSQPPQTPYADVTAYLKDTLIQTVLGYIRQLAASDKDEVGTAYDGASAAVQAQVDALLGRS